MNINELFEILQDNLSDELSGEMILDRNTIVWSYILEDVDDENQIDEEDDDYFSYVFII
jgi:hypothetical protein